MMFILALGGKSYARLRFNVGPGGSVVIPVVVDYSQAFGPSAPPATSTATTSWEPRISSATSARPSGPPRARDTPSPRPDQRRQPYAAAWEGRRRAEAGYQLRQRDQVSDTAERTPIAEDDLRVRGHDVRPLRTRTLGLLVIAVWTPRRRMGR